MVEVEGKVHVLRVRVRRSGKRGQVEVEVYNRRKGKDKEEQEYRKAEVRDKWIKRVSF